PPPHTALHSFPTRRSSDLDDIGHAAFEDAIEPLRPAGEHAADHFVGHFGRGDVEHSLDEPRLDQPLHRPPAGARGMEHQAVAALDRKSTRLNSSHVKISYA